MERHPVGIRSVKLGSELVINSPTKYSCFFNFLVKEKDKKVKKNCSKKHQKRKKIF